MRAPSPRRPGVASASSSGRAFSRSSSRRPRHSRRSRPITASVVSISPMRGKIFFIAKSWAAGSTSVMASAAKVRLYARSCAARAVESDPDARRDPREHDSGDLPTPELEVELRSVERAPLPLRDEDVSRLRSELRDELEELRRGRQRSGGHFRARPERVPAVRGAARRSRARPGGWRAGTPPPAAPCSRRRPRMDESSDTWRARSGGRSRRERSWGRARWRAWNHLTFGGKRPDPARVGVAVERGGRAARVISGCSRR